VGDAGLLGQQPRRTPRRLAQGVRLAARRPEHLTPALAILRVAVLAPQTGRSGAHLTLTGGEGGPGGVEGFGGIGFGGSDEVLPRLRDLVGRSRSGRREAIRRTITTTPTALSKATPAMTSAVCTSSRAQAR
jgi:hypothetical protein